MSNPGSGDRTQEAVDRLQDEVAALRRSRRRLAEVGYSDRRAIERELHDGVQQHLVGLAVNLQRLDRLVDDDPTAAKALLGQMVALVQEALDAAMELARSVQPPLLEGRGLASALRLAAERAGVTVEVDVPTRAGYPPEVTAAVYWSCVGVLSSASPGSSATVGVHDADSGLTFEVSIADRLADDHRERLRDRVEALEGRVSVADPRDGGSRVQGWLPSSS